MAKTKTKLKRVLKDPVEEQDMPQAVPDPNWEARQERSNRLGALAYQRMEKILLKTETLSEDDRSELEALRGIVFGYF
jgi:hypothetical protein